MAAATEAEAICCPLCDYGLAASPGSPVRPGGHFTADVTCPECGTSMPAGSRVLEGALHPVSLRPNSPGMIVALVANIVFFLFIATQAMSEAFRVAPGVTSRLLPFLAIQSAVMGCLVVALGWEVWRRSRFARTSAFLAGREIRWIVAPDGLECIDRSRPLKQPTRTRIEASRVYRVTALAEGPKVADGRKPAARLVAWNWTVDGNGRRVDLAPLAVFTLGERADEVAVDLERILGLPTDVASRPPPRTPLADRQSRFRFVRIVMLSAIILMFLGMVFVPRELMIAWFVGLFLLAASVVWATNAALAAARRRWVRGRSLVA